jgi:hypothetical protein
VARAPSSPAADASRADVRRGLRIAALLLVPAALGLLAAVQHEWWRDEAYTWLVAGESPSIGALVDNLGFNGHPRPYYILAWLLYRVNANPLILALVNLALALGASAFLFASAPLSALQALLFSIGFYPLYQYGVVVRCYSLFLFLLFAYCHLRERQPARVAARLLLLAALAQVHLMSMAAAGLLLGFEWLERNRSGRRWGAKQWASAAAVAASLLLALWEIVPRGGSGSEAVMRGSLRMILRGFANGYFPNYGSLDGTRPQVGLGLALWLASFALLWRRWRALLLYLALGGSLAFMCVFIYWGCRWHHGFYFVYLVPALWIAGERALVGWKAQLLTLCLVLQAVVGGYALGRDVLYPYSGGAGVARFCEAKGLAGLPAVGMFAVRRADGVIAYRFEIDRIQPVLVSSPRISVFDPNTGTFERFYKHYSQGDYFPLEDPAAMAGSLASVAKRIPVPFLVVVSRAPDVAAIDLPAPITKLGDFPALGDYGESYSLYLWPGP